MLVSETSTVTIVAYNPQWPVMFTELRRVLGTALGTLAVSIEHVGSTAVPGLAAKPIIDLDVVIASSARLPDAIQALDPLGYVHEGDFGIAGREALSRQDHEVPRDGTGRTWPKHHVYICARGGAELVKHACRTWVLPYRVAHQGLNHLRRAINRRLHRAYKSNRRRLEQHERLSSLPDSKLKAIGLVAFLYAALFSVEGVGLWMAKRWAEYLTIIATSSFVPFEVYELVRRASWQRGATLGINLLVVGYLIWKVRQHAA